MALAPLPGLAGREQRAHRLEPVGGDDPAGHQVPQALLHLDGEAAGGVAELGVEHRPPCPQGVEHVARRLRGRARSATASPRAACRSQGRSSRRAKVTGVARDGVAEPRRAVPSASAGRRERRPQTSSPDVAEVLEPAVLVALDPGREDGLLPGAGGDLESLELVDHGQHAGPPLALRTRGRRAATAGGTA